MREIRFDDNMHGDTVFFERNGIQQAMLFGLEMQPEAKHVSRLCGMFDLFCGIGAANDHVVSVFEKRGNEIFCETKLFGGSVVYETRIEYIREFAVQKRRDTIRNTGTLPITINRAMMRMMLAFDKYEAHHQGNRWCYENIGSWHEAGSGGVSLACEGGRTTQGAAPFLALRNPEGKGFVLHLIPDGNWQIQLKAVSQGVGYPGEFAYLLEFGQSGEHFALNLDPGGEYCLPEVLIQKLDAGGLARSALNLQRYFLKTDNKRHRIEHPLVYNPWFEHYALLEENRLKQHVAAAKELGCEVFEVDAGWYGGGGGDWWSRSGDWSERSDGAFYGRMSEFADYVRSQGMGFGLWMEPERIGKDTPIMKLHPEYFAQGEEYYYAKLWQPEVYAYMLGEISGLVERYGLVWMKMDFNFELGEDEAASGFYLYYRAWYKLLGELAEKYPEVFFEACASGGQRSDVNTVLAYDGHFLSDNVNCVDMYAAYRQCCQRLPHYRLIKWLVVSPGAKISLYDSTDSKKIDTIITTSRPGAGWDDYERIAADFACALTVCGMVGVSGNFIDLTSEQKGVFKKYLEFYKRSRAFFKESTLYMSGETMNVGDTDGFSHLQYLRESDGECLIFCYRFLTARVEKTIFLQGLDEDAKYKMISEPYGEELGVYSGEQLMYRGLRTEYLSRRSAKIYRLVKETW